VIISRVESLEIKVPAAEFFDISLSREEANYLVTVLRHVGGPPNEAPRKALDELFNGLLEVGITNGNHAIVTEGGSRQGFYIFAKDSKDPLLTAIRAQQG